MSIFKDQNRTDTVRAAEAFAQIADTLAGQDISRGGYKTPTVAYTYGQDPIIGTIKNAPSRHRANSDNAVIQSAMGALQRLFERRGLQVEASGNSLEVKFRKDDLPSLYSIRDQIVAKPD